MGVRIPPGLPFFNVITMAEKIRKLIQFLKEVKAETKRVSWPSRRDTIAGTVVVLVIVFITAFYLGIVDFVPSQLIKRFLS